MRHIFFNEEHELFRKTIQDFLLKEVSPHINTWEAEGKVDRGVLKKMGEMGYFGLEVDEKYGGSGLDFLYSAVLLEARLILL